VPRSALRIRWK